MVPGIRRRLLERFRRRVKGDGRDGGSVSEEVVRSAEGGVLLEVSAVPGAAEAGVDGRDPWRGALKVRLRSPPVQGRANAELVEVLAEHFRVPRSSVSVVSGLRSRRKTVLLGGLSLKEALGRLEGSR
jgi:uncharacterized protein (TIGR00251 family)